MKRSAFRFRKQTAVPMAQAAEATGVDVAALAEALPDDWFGEVVDADPPSEE
jgi:hypothetical protein